MANAAFIEKPRPLPLQVIKKNHRDDSNQIKEYKERLLSTATEFGLTDIYLQSLEDQSYYCDLIGNHTNEDLKTSSPTAGQPLIISGAEEEQVYDEEIKIVDIRDIYAEIQDQVVQSWLYHLVALENHPQHLLRLAEISRTPFSPPQEYSSPLMDRLEALQEVKGISEFSLIPRAKKAPRVSRGEIRFDELYVNYGTYDPVTRKHTGRYQARSLMVVGENPDICASPPFLANQAATHHLVGIPRDGLFSDIPRQAQLVAETRELLASYAKFNAYSIEEEAILFDWYMHNLVGVLESDPTKAIKRAKALYDEGIRTFRIYSPEPNYDLVKCVQELRTYANRNGWEEIEIFAGQVIDLEQAEELEKEGVNAIYEGVGGGGRCITGKVANLAINWPQVQWKIRGKFNRPTIIQGGANENIATTLALGASGIGIVGGLGGTVDTPGGWLYLLHPKTGKFGKYYGGEASDRARKIAERVDSEHRTIHSEGETAIKLLQYLARKGIYPNSLLLMEMYLESAAGGLVFQHAGSIQEMQAVAPASLRLEGVTMKEHRNTH